MQALGIDLGTTFSSVCIINEQKIDIVADKLGIKLIPSIASFKLVNDELMVYIGKYAQNKNPLMTVYDSKRMIAQRYDDDYIKKLRKKWPFKIEKSETGGILICLDAINKKYEPYQISGEILKYLAYVGNLHLGEKKKTNKVVITIPANFGEEQRQETIRAAEYANLEVLRILNEPTAAGIAYSIENQDNIDRYILIFDFGGGTLDISLLHVNDHNITVTATDGDMFLGGRDFDENTTEYLLKKFKVKTTDPKTIWKFREMVEDTKKVLSTYSSCPIDLSEFDTQNEEETLTLQEFEQINKKLIDRITVPIERLLKKVNFSKQDIDSIILVGGSSNMQFVKEKLKIFFGKEPIFKINPTYAVVTGAGIVASKEINNEGLPFQLRNIEFKDICPFSIGTFTNDGTFSIIIKKDSPISTPGRERFHTILYHQKSLSIKVYECYDDDGKNKKYLTKLDVYDLPISEDEVWFEISFYLDKNNILKVAAKLIDDDKKYEKEVQIKRISPHSIKKKKDDDDDDDDDDVDDDDEDEDEDEILMDDFELFYLNIKRFIEYNKDSLETFKQINLGQIQKDIEVEKNNPDLKPTNLKLLADSYILKLKPYFQSHPLPKFLQY